MRIIMKKTIICRHHLRVLITWLLVFMALCGGNKGVMVGYAESSLSLTFDREFGIGLGDSIQGRFTIHGSGGTEIVRLQILFNGNIEANASGNTLHFSFSTDDYPLGEYNITLQGWDSSNQQTQISTVKKFISPWYNMLIILVVVGIIALRYGGKIRDWIQKKRNTNHPDPKPEITVKSDVL